MKTEEADLLSEFRGRLKCSAVMRTDIWSVTLCSATVSEYAASYMTIHGVVSV